MATLPGINLGGNTSAQSAQFAQPIFSNQQYRSALGQSTANLSNTLGIPHIGVSDWIAGHPVTPTTGKASADYVSPVPNGGPNPPQNTIQARAQSDRAAAYRASGGQGDVPVGFNGFESPVQEDPYAALKSEIGSAWDSYLSGLQSTEGYLNDQQAAQRGIADSQLRQGMDTVNSQKAQSLKDIANTTRSAFQAGNNYLGSMGAGDSSAANQYAFAINQQAGKQTGDLNNFVNTQIQNLTSTHDQQINQIAQWFAQQQEQLKKQIAQGQLSKGQDIANLSKGILDQAMQATNQIKQNTQAQQNALLQWAAGNSSNMGQLKQQIAEIPQAMGQLNQMGGVGGGVRYGGAPTATQETDIFGQPIR